MKKYFCSKCKKQHHRGKIYREHLKFKQEMKSLKPPDKGNLKVSLESFRSIAKRQLNRLLKKMDETGNHQLYKNEIIKLIKKENRR
ncbi:MAG: hypothetical protein ACFFB0_09235 [Promethearchaeota archaeon]